MSQSIWSDIASSVALGLLIAGVVIVLRGFVDRSLLIVVSGTPLIVISGVLLLFVLYGEKNREV